MVRVPSAAEIQYMQEHIGDDKSTSIIVANVLCVVAAYIAVILRFVSRRFVLAGLKADDWWIVAGLAIYTGFIIGFSISTAYGAGRHIILVTDAKALALDNIADESLYCAAIVAIKFSILFLYDRVFPVRWFKIASISTRAFIFAWALAAFFCGIFQCVPISSQWDPTVSGYCIDYGHLVIATGAINIITDFIILGLPVPMVWQLKISRTRKWLLTATFMMGGCACIVSIVRLFYVREVGSSSDPSWDNINGGILSTVELCVGIFAACIPTYRPLFNRIVHGSANRPTVRGSSNYQFHHPANKTVEHPPEQIDMSVKLHGGGSSTWAREDDAEDRFYTRMS